jgi:hypothetical protein
MMVMVMVMVMMMMMMMKGVIERMVVREVLAR